MFLYYEAVTLVIYKSLITVMKSLQ